MTGRAWLALPLVLWCFGLGCLGADDAKTGEGGGTGGTGGVDPGPVNRERALWTPGAPAYTVADGTVADARTGLTWERGCSADEVTHAAGVARCEDLDLGGARDWRLPTEAELLSLVDPTALAPAIDTAAFPAGPSAGVWTDSRFLEYDDAGIAVDFYDGDTDSEGRDHPHFVRCVRGGRSVVASYQLGAETVHDTGTGLTWQRAESPRVATFEDATAWCDALVAGGADDWRLPTLHELVTLLVPDVLEPTLDRDAFPDAHPEGYWTSTAYRAEPAVRWAVGFGGEFAGLTFALADPDEFFTTGPHARCVR